MNICRPIARTAAALAVILPLSSELLAHGGQYRGPPDIVPPAPGGSGSGGPTAGPSGPSGPGATRPGTGASTGTGGVGGGRAAPPGSAAPPSTNANAPKTPGGRGPVPTDLTQWQLWWEFNKDPFIRLKEAIHTNHATSGDDRFYLGIGEQRRSKDTRKPTDTQIDGEVLPALRDAIERTDQRDIVSSVLIAMGKIGRNHRDFEILPIMREKLTAADQEIRETAAVAMGISQLVQGVDSYLVHLVADDETGRKLVGRNSVDYRTRSFAAYGLGLVAHSTSNAAVKARCLQALQEIISDDSIVSRDVRVAAIHGLSLVKPNPLSNDAAEQKVFAGALETLESYFLRSLGAGDQLIQSHVPTAIAKLLGPDAPADLVAHYKELFLAELQGKSSVRRKSNDIYRSSVLALGKLAMPNDGRPDNPDLKYSRALLDYFKTGKDQQTRNFALIALGQIGGAENRNELLKAFQKGNTLERPWAALALGVYVHNVFEAEGNADSERLVGQTLHKALDDHKNPETVSAMAIALGLCRYREAGDDLLNLLIQKRRQDQLAGYLSIGLALMNYQLSKEDITDIVADSVRRPELLSQAAIALGKLGDRQVTGLLQNMMVEGDQTLAKMSAIASALGFIGDRDSIRPLKEMLFNDRLTDLTRAFAAVALGGVADKENLPWNSKIAVDINYRAAVETLTTGASGILDIL